MVVAGRGGGPRCFGIIVRTAGADSDQLRSLPCL